MNDNKNPNAFLNVTIAIVILTTIIWLMVKTSNTSKTDPYEDNPLANPDFHREGAWPK